MTGHHEDQLPPQRLPRKTNIQACRAYGHPVPAPDRNRTIALTEA